MLLTLELSKNVNSACRTVMNSGIYTMCKLCDSSVVVLSRVAWWRGRSILYSNFQGCFGIRANLNKIINHQPHIFYKLKHTTTLHRKCYQVLLSLRSLRSRRAVQSDTKANTPTQTGDSVSDVGGS